MSIVEMIVHMDCTGCERKIKKALLKLDGVNEVDTDMAMQKVTVMGWVDQEKVLKRVRKTGRTAELWPYPHNPEYSFIRHYYHQHQRYLGQPVTYHAYHDQSTSSDYMDAYSAQLDLYSPYQPPPYSTTNDNWQATTMFNDDNPNACSIM